MGLRTMSRWLPMLLLALMAMGCGSQKPKKYRKKRGCDCPHFNHLPPRSGDGARASSMPPSVPGAEAAREI
jgi:hypothetical protein